MKRWTTLSALGLLLGACRMPPAAPQFTSSSDTPHTFVEAPPQRDPQAVEDPPVPTISAGQCPDVVADFPEPYFQERVLIRLPAPVTSDDLLETAPDRAQLLSPVLLSTCNSERPPVTLERMTLTLVDPDHDRSIIALRDEVLRAHGLYEDATLIEAEVDSEQREAEWVFATPTSKRLVVLRTSNQAAVVVTYEVSAADWPLVVNSLRDSGKRVSIIPQ